ncbi:MAG: sodium:calcium antiporter [Alphaproteobacteria bacterium]|nr:sodium:calcium antiporter [Alphaproteobacteria bacterium]
MSTELAAALFAGCGLIILVAGVRLTRTADEIAKGTRLGGALTGAVIMGAVTSLSGIATSIAAAWQGHAELALSNAFGGIAAQTAFLCIADITYRRANLEHAAPSLTNLFNGVLLMTLLSLPLIAAVLPPVSYFAIHPVTPLILIVYGFGLRLAGKTYRQPMWGPAQTGATAREDEDGPRLTRGRLVRLSATVLGLGSVVAAAGYGIAESGIALSERLELSEGFVGASLTAVTTSLPELVTTIAAVRRGALSLAVGGILGGNTFDVLFAVFSDVAYREGSIYHAIGPSQIFTILITILMVSILLMGFLLRERHGFGNIGFESTLMLLVYAFGLAMIGFVF